MPSYLTTHTPDITETIPAVVSARTFARTVAATGAKFDVSVADIPFFLACSANSPYLRETADPRKPQIDTSKEAGEQSLDQGLWSRSQASFHLGAGVTYYEPGADDGTEFRYASSVGVDPWTIGSLSLLKTTTNPQSTGGYVGVTGAVVGGVDVYFTNLNGTLSRSDGTTVTGFTGSTSLVGKPAVTGANVLVGASGQIWKGTASGTTVASMGFTGVTGNLIPYWAKSRIIATNANSLYELTLSSTGALPTALYTHPDTGWTWTDVTETTDAILACGYSGGYGAIYRFSLTTPASGTIPTLSAGFQLSEFPTGEIPYAIKAYLGKYIAIGTSRGLRVGTINGATAVSPTIIQYGPLTVTTTSPVTCLAANDAYIYAGVTNALDGNSGAVRVSLQQEVIQGSLRFPYAYDANSHTTGTMDSIAFLGNTSRVILGVDGRGVYQQSATTYETTGYIITGRVRYATSELKAFRAARMRAEFPDGNCGVSLTTIAPNGSANTIINLTSASNSDDFIALSQPIGQFEYLSFKLILSSTGATTPTLESLLIKALPAPVRSHIVQYPLLLLDFEADYNGTRVGEKGYAFSRLAALEALESAQAIVTIQDMTTGESYDATIEKVSMQRISPPNKSNGNNFGGLVTVSVRKFD